MNLIHKTQITLTLLAAAVLAACSTTPVDNALLVVPLGWNAGLIACVDPDLVHRRIREAF